MRRAKHAFSLCRTRPTASTFFLAAEGRVQCLAPTLVGAYNANTHFLTPACLNWDAAVNKFFASSDSGSEGGMLYMVVRNVRDSVARPAQRRTTGPRSRRQGRRKCAWALARALSLSPGARRRVALPLSTASMASNDEQQEGDKEEQRRAAAAAAVVQASVRRAAGRRRRRAAAAAVVQAIARRKLAAGYHRRLAHSRDERDAFQRQRFVLTSRLSVPCAWLERALSSPPLTDAITRAHARCTRSLACSQATRGGLHTTTVRNGCLWLSRRPSRCPRRRRGNGLVLLRGCRPGPLGNLCCDAGLYYRQRRNTGP